MFVRIFRPNEQREILFNTDHIRKIEVSYGVPDGGGDYWRTSLNTGLENPDAVRAYRVFVGEDEFFFISNPDDAVVKVFEEIYRNAIKG